MCGCYVGGEGRVGVGDLHSFWEPEEEGSGEEEEEEEEEEAEGAEAVVHPPQ